MRKRLRKKFYKGEFQELGFELNGKFSKDFTIDNIDKFYDDFIEYVESIDCEIGGGNSGQTFDFFVAKASRGSITSEQKSNIVKWVTNYHSIDEVLAGELRDVWYGWNNE